MAKTPEQEREEIRNGFAAADADSIRALREFAVAFCNGHEIPQATSVRLIAIESGAHELRKRDATLKGRAPPERPAILDAKPVEAAPEPEPGPVEFNPVAVRAKA